MVLNNIILISIIYKLLFFTAINNIIVKYIDIIYLKYYV